MGKIVQLQSKKTGENEYPRTYTKAVIDDNGTPLPTLMQLQEDKITELGSEVDNVFYLFSKEFSTENKFYSAIDGSYSYSSVVASTDLIQIINKEIFAYCYLGGNEYPQYGIVFFDKDKRFINSSYNTEQKGYKKVYLTNEIPQNAVYFVA